MQQPSIKELKEWRNVMLMHRFALEEVNTKLKILNDEFQFIHDYNPMEHLKSRVKSFESITTKLERKGLDITPENAYAHVRDIAGIRITCSFVSDIYKIYEMLANQDDMTILNVKDYVENPKPNGYRSFHLICEVPIFLTNTSRKMCVEIQIRTVAMDFWASLEHKIYYKYKSTAPAHLTQELYEAAAIIQHLDDKMKYLNDEIDQYKNEVEGKE
ncbi:MULTISPECIES: GTP pyrophosphokinase [Listeria]|uniref:GTP pyrophosphokinase n=2 Tax=Listeria TaxID=1637 RepID=A0A099W8M4_9LIST|nr:MULTISPECIES: GTP pyrophosphokinase family protein [Listeria]EUJ46985.1 putative GTP-pyrophosphokinase [Listeria riparia FSL S10-1204]KGL40803.1 GTP pyrophosphokinase [Listeria booriae]MBC1209974.1 GTP pyrophosphokinase family protein [Listeria booriae]MBC1291886.1 GTP pyrophosphokinase family protein [Listeria booriae]MBC1334098.1 GTP pyrophosphokinase family protein [Listeria booriae]